MDVVFTVEPADCFPVDVFKLTGTDVVVVDVLVEHDAPLELTSGITYTVCPFGSLAVCSGTLH